MAINSPFGSIPPEALEPVLRAEAARRRLIDFCTHVDPRYIPAKHLVLLATHLESLERRDIRRLAISMPPRHGKTDMLRKFVAWYMGLHPDHHVISQATALNSPSRARGPFGRWSATIDTRFPASRYGKTRAVSAGGKPKPAAILLRSVSGAGLPVLVAI